jgi:nicotinate phosphoribosyltransferase
MTAEPGAVSSPLLTDLYQLSMAQGYYHAGRVDDEAVFQLFFRSLPFGGGYALAAGLEPALELLENYGFAEDDLAYLATLLASEGSALFSHDKLIERARIGTEV